MPSSPLVPRYAFLIKGEGEDESRLQAFDIALREAGPLVHNLVSVSSILPAGCKFISKEEGISMLVPGQITFCVMARQDSNILGETVSASVGTAQFRNKDHYGFISEHHAIGQSAKEAGDYAENLAVQMFALKLGLSLNEFSLIVSSNITQTATVTKQGNWACALAVCVFCL